MMGDVHLGKFDRTLGLFYMSAQLLGSCCGILISLIYFADYDRRSLIIVPGDLWKSTLLETISSFILVFMYLCSTEEKTRFTKDKVV